MTNAATHSHHSRRSIRRKLARRALVGALPGSATGFDLCTRNDHSLSPPLVRAVRAMRGDELRVLRGSPYLPIRSCTRITKQPSSFRMESAQNVQISGDTPLSKITAMRIQCDRVPSRTESLYLEQVPNNSTIRSGFAPNWILGDLKKCYRVRAVSCGAKSLRLRKKSAGRLDQYNGSGGDISLKYTKSLRLSVQIPDFLTPETTPQRRKGNQIIKVFGRGGGDRTHKPRHSYHVFTTFGSFRHPPTFH